MTAWPNYIRDIHIRRYIVQYLPEGDWPAPEWTNYCYFDELEDAITEMDVLSIIRSIPARVIDRESSFVITSENWRERWSDCCEEQYEKFDMDWKEMGF